jgi:uncharacterized protein YjbJ (UPF0337 family)
MTNHMDELNDKVKQEYGKLAGDEQVEAEGADEAGAAPRGT